MDIYLPGRRDGVDAAIEIFKRCGVRSIFASAPADPAAEILAAAARPLGWLRKPFSDKKLIATVESGIANVERAAYPSPMPKLGARDEKNTNNSASENPTLAGSEAEFPHILAEIASLKNPAPELAAWALAEVWRGVVTGEGPSVRGRRHFSRTIAAGDAALCEHILIAAGERFTTAGHVLPYGGVRAAVKVLASADPPGCGESLLPRSSRRAQGQQQRASDIPRSVQLRPQRHGGGR
jgi:hypothetical protein